MVSSKYVTSSFGSAKFFFFIYKDMFKSFNKSDFSFPAFLYKFFLDFSNKVSDSYESETALFCAKRCQKVPQIFFSKSATISALSAQWCNEQQKVGFNRIRISNSRTRIDVDYYSIFKSRSRILQSNICRILNGLKSRYFVKKSTPN